MLTIIPFLSLLLAPTSFCKCTCFSNSTIIPLDPASSRSSSALDNVLHLYNRALDSFPTEAPRETEDTITGREQKYRALSCNDCNRKFCLTYELPTCKGAKEEDVFTTCFQRDSRKDEAVVFIFIFATGGLLGWALLKPWIEKYLEVRVLERRGSADRTYQSRNQIAKILNVNDDLAPISQVPVEKGHEKNTPMTKLWYFQNESARQRLCWAKISNDITARAHPRNAGEIARHYRGSGVVA
ncbi:uncharacterized protein N7459_006779 [Penicillium hispanicum]|uniref:uncharacterized protein n=1 Tax=Penicillium hispanicum TaxID=1080232 RepID=UPI0025417798|nr:uncharacterized protein N7459_006779 [Penicillium hispanicum]KAJ5577815.1 hypothetical protein N7459_006779 [Penicillium hispanicum]